jgi:selenocysteine-specific elongation factor
LKQIILGTAGHIDHGKTSLIKAVTGINTDRLKEEQLRGITIELGFATLDLPSGQHVGIVDVPGHEKFIKNMVAGATGIDLVTMVIAADEGIMPQTKEHFEICSLLDIQKGMVVLTKIDLVDEEWLMLVQDEIASFTQNTFLENAPVIPVSATTGQGLPEFLNALDEICTRIPARSSSGLFRLPVDRVFTMKGFGTVITGTLAAGKVCVGDQVMLYPSEVTSKVRGLQVHNQSVAMATAGMRTAINFQGLDKAVVNRGDIVAMPETLVSSHMVDAILNYLPGNTKALKNRTRVRFHSGTNEIMGRVILLNCDEVLPGDTAWVQLRLEAPVTLIKDDHYVLRSYSPVHTIGGGRIIHPIPSKHKPHKPEVIDLLAHITSGTSEQIVAALIAATGHIGCLLRDLLIMANLPHKQLDQTLQSLASQQQIVQIDKERHLFVHQQELMALQKRIRTHLAAFHQQFPLKPGVPKEELKSKLPLRLNAKLFQMALQRMVKEEEVIQEEDILHLANHEITLDADEEGVRHQIMTIYEKGELMPPYFKEVAQKLATSTAQAKQVLSLLADEGLLVKIKEDLYYHHQPIAALKHQLVKFLLANGEISTPQFKDMTGASRKFVIPLLEYFDSLQLTIRVGDIRKLRKQPNE